MPATDARTILRSLFDAAVAAADPVLCVSKNLPAAPKGRTIVVGAGKAAAAMAAAVEAHWPGPLEGLVVTRVRPRRPDQAHRVVEAGHPVPDAAGGGAAARILSMVQGLSRPTISSSASSRAAARRCSRCRRPRLTLADKQAVNRALLSSGARSAR